MEGLSITSKSFFFNFSLQYFTLRVFRANIESNAYFNHRSKTTLSWDEAVSIILLLKETLLSGSLGDSQILLTPIGSPQSIKLTI